MGQIYYGVKKHHASDSTFFRYEYSRPFYPGAGVAASPSRALGPAERESVLACLHEERFQDRSPAAVDATLRDEGQYLCSIRSMYRLVEKRGESRERRDQLTHPRLQEARTADHGSNQLWFPGRFG